MSKPVIICVDDEKVVLDSLSKELEFAMGDEFVIEPAESGEEALELVQDLLSQNRDIPAFISDQLMPGMKGDELLKEVHRIIPNTRKILLTGQATMNSVVNAINQANLYRYIAKPWDTTDLKLTVQEAVKSYFLDSKLSKHVAILERINKTTTQLAQEVRVSRLVQALINEIITYLDLDKVSIVFPAHQSHLNKHISIQNGQHLYLEDTQLPYEIITQSYKEKKVIVENNAVYKPDYKNQSYIQSNRVASLVIHPMVYKNETIATIYAEKTKKSDYFTNEHLTYLKLLLDQAATMLDNAFLYEGLEQVIAERTQVIEQQNKDIQDSIRYARRIQFAVMPSVVDIQKFIPNSFIFFSPKDIVSGDFYWALPAEEYFFIAAGDCTGHGVPGAFMSLIGSMLLHNIVSEYRIYDTGKILTELHNAIRKTLQSNPTDEYGLIQDGMDISLCRINLKTKHIQFSGANHILYIFQNGQMYEHKTDKMPIGGQHEYTFTTYEIQFNSNDILYMFTDGITDQFGGEEGKKFSRKQLASLLESIHTLPAQQQLERIQKHILEWRKDIPQTDDMLVIGISL
ncbi:MAG: SpoIIE family protein phosphatase [Bacteroidia bacterium]|nr:SpoIIE family protein phosphatase [Bacteroidia bacterium]MDW8301976.1 SpoIIE family protein phosphatase [Bacteroidia bacterium]